MRIFISFLVLILILSCNRKSKVQDAHLSIVDSLTLPINSADLITLNVVKSTDQSDSLLLLQDHSRNVIFLYELSSRNVVDSINLNRYTTEEPNSVAASLCAQGKLYILEGERLIMKVIDLPSGRQSELRNKNASSTVGLITPLLMPLIVQSDRTFFATQIAVAPLRTREQFAKFYQNNPLAKFRLTDSSFECVSTFGAYPDSYKTGLYDNLFFPAIPLNRDTLLYCFNGLQCFMHSSIKEQTARIPIDFEVPPMPPLNFDSVGSLSYSKSLSIRTPSVARLHYKPTSDRLLIFYKPPAEPLSAEGELNTYVDCDNYILSVPLRKEEPILRYLIPKRFEFRASILFQDKLIWKSREEAGKMKLYMVKLNEDAIH